MNPAVNDLAESLADAYRTIGNMKWLWKFWCRDMVQAAYRAGLTYADAQSAQELFEASISRPTF